MKRLQLYYWYIGIPVFLVALGTAIFFDAIMGTVRGNPHPQINYIIFVLIVLGCYQTLMHVWRINREGDLFRQYRKMIESGIQDHEIEALLGDFSKKHDVVPLIQLIQGLRGKPVTQVQHAAAESEMERFAARQSRRLMMSQFMGGLMVGMGLLGTFIGLLGALAEIGKLIGSFNLGAGMTDPLATISELVARLTAPMQAMGVAFSASLFGVLGSLIMGVLMVGVKGAATDLVSFIQSDTALLLEITPQEEISQDHESVVKAMAQLAENSPLLRGLAVALDHSERRVRELLGGMAALVSRVETTNHASSSLVQQIQRQSRQHENLLLANSQLHEVQASANARLDELIKVMERSSQTAGQQREMVHAALQEQTRQFSRQVAAQEELWRQNLGQHAQHIEQLARTLNQQASNKGRMHEQNLVFQQNMLEALSAATSQVCREAQSRSETLARVDAMLRENQFRNEQIVQLLAQAVQRAQTSTT